MKRIALLGFIFFVVPVIFMACNPCSQSLKDYPKYRTYSIIENQIFKPDSMKVYLENDTLFEDTIQLKIKLSSNYFSLFQKQKHYNNYALMACDPAEPREKNSIKSFFFGLAINGNIQNPDTVLLKSMELNIYGSGYKWQNEKDKFLENFNSHEQQYFNLQFISPHNSSNIQFVTWAIKENGDTLKAVSQKVFCK